MAATKPNALPLTQDQGTGLKKVGTTPSPGICVRAMEVLADWQQALGAENEKGQMAQFWYSPRTIACLLQQCRRPGVTKVAMLSAPSLYFALTRPSAGPCDQIECASTPEDPEAWLFEFDTRWDSEERFVYFDYREGVEGVPAAHAGQYDLIVADPPNLLMSTVETYISVVKHLSQQQGAQVLFVTSGDWYGLMLNGLNAFAMGFEPVMPTAAWSQCGRFRLFANYRDAALQEVNPDALGKDEDEDASYEDYTGYYLGMPDDEL